jgi:prepilin signal peptidase PulO-like enzyme (type II secretory pathway)
MWHHLVPLLIGLSLIHSSFWLMKQCHCTQPIATWFVFLPFLCHHVYPFLLLFFFFDGIGFELRASYW